MADDDALLVQRCLDGDEAALRLLIGQFQQIVFSLCYRMVGQREDAEDVAQDSLLRMVRKLEQWDPTRPLTPWVLTIAANRCRTFLEKRSRRPVASDMALAAVGSDGRDDDRALAEELEQALGQLREEYRTCFVLFHQQELSCAEIGEILDCPQGTVKTWLYRARRELAEILQRRGIGPGARHELHRL